MLFWIIGITMSVIVATVFVVVLTRKSISSTSDSLREIDFYKSQLDEITSEGEQNLINQDDVESSKHQISRRLLRAYNRAENEQLIEQANRKPTAIASASISVVVILGSIYIYLNLGSVGLPDNPMKDRIEEAENVRIIRPTQFEVVSDHPSWTADESTDPELINLIERLRNSVSVDDPDPEGLRLLVRSEFTIGNISAAIQAQERFVNVMADQSTAEDYSTLAELLITEARGYVSPEAEKAILMALELDNSEPVARYFIGLMYGQTGRPDLAVGIWNKLINDIPLDSPLQQKIRIRLPAARILAGLPEAAISPSAPELDQETLDAAQSMTESERSEFIGNMVLGLEQRLLESGGSDSEWSLLIKSQIVLGRHEDALKSFERAKLIFVKNPEIIQSIIEATGIVPPI